MSSLKEIENLIMREKDMLTEERDKHLEICRVLARRIEDMELAFSIVDEEGKRIRILEEKMGIHERERKD